MTMPSVSHVDLAVGRGDSADSAEPQQQVQCTKSSSSDHLPIKTGDDDAETHSSRNNTNASGQHSQTLRGRSTRASGAAAPVSTIGSVAHPRSRRESSRDKSLVQEEGVTVIERAISPKTRHHHQQQQPSDKGSNMEFAFPISTRTRRR
jgi:hypothetical protein